jgi:hypothetical protein
MKLVSGTGILLLSAIIGNGCEHEIDMPTQGEQATLSQIQTTIFDLRCGVSGCHVAGGSGPMRLDSQSESFDNLVNIPASQKPQLMRVRPSQPENSYLIHKLEGQPDISRQRMPPGGPFLSSDEIGRIRTWIAEGAANN